MVDRLTFQNFAKRVREMMSDVTSRQLRSKMFTRVHIASDDVAWRADVSSLSFDDHGISSALFAPIFFENNIAPRIDNNRVVVVALVPAKHKRNLYTHTNQSENVKLFGEHCG